LRRPICDWATARALELDRFVRLLQSFACTDLGQARIAALQPRPTDSAPESGGADWDQPAQRRALGEALAGLFGGGDLVRPLDGEETSNPPSDDSTPGVEADDRTSGEISGAEPDSLQRLRALLDRTSAGLDGGTLVRLATVAGAVGAVAKRLERSDEDTVILLLDEWNLDQSALREFAELVLRRLDPRGEVRPDATPALRALSQRVHRARRALYRQFEAYVQEHQEVLAEPTLSAREGRLTALLPAGHRGRLAGLHHGRSATGRSYYFEPFELVEANNETQEARGDEEAERARIVAELAAAARACSKQLGRALDLWGLLDEQQAIARFSRAAQAQYVEDADEGVGLRLIQARHPLLDPQLRSMRRRALGESGHDGEIVPLDLEFGEARVVVITGPNAGGKTVALKTVGLLSLLHASGLPVPSLAGSRLPAFRRVIAVIGDEQDLLHDRSTFSARLLRLREVWEDADRGSLILLDELGSGTNPQEGAALSEPLLERLIEVGASAVLTTHLVELAALAHELPGALCAGMEFDPIAERPRFRIRIGPPAGSQALALGRRLGLPSAWLAAAEKRLGSEYRTLISLIAEVEEQRDAAVAESARAASLRADQEILTRRLEQQEAELREKSKTLRTQLDQRLKEARAEARTRLENEVTRLAQAARERAERGDLASVAGARALHSAVERVVRPIAEDAEQLLGQEPEPRSAGPPVQGASVRHRTLGWRGVLESVQGRQATVAAAGKRLRCALDDLVTEPATLSAAAGSSTSRRAARGRSAPPVGRVSGAGAAGGAEVATELNLIGQRVEPALSLLDDYLDKALLNGLESVRVVHGHGTGRLRDAVRRHLSDHPVALEFTPAEPRQGGNGATQVVLQRRDR
jgi:DNA mismatch repair protein MutS2